MRRLILVALSVGVVSCLGDYALARPSLRHATAPTLVAPVVVPHATYMELAVAYERLHRAGLRVTFSQPIWAGSALNVCPPRIGRQFPRAGRRVRKDAVVELFAQPFRCNEGSPSVPVGGLPSAQVPDFAGHLISDAGTWADGHGLYWDAINLPPLLAGDAPSLLDNYRVTSQRPAAGRFLALGIAKGGGNHGSFLPTPLNLRGEPIQRVVGVPRAGTHRVDKGS